MNIEGFGGHIEPSAFLDDGQRAVNVIATGVGKRLTYADMVA